MCAYYDTILLRHDGFHVMIFFVQTINANTLQYETDTKWDIVN